MQFAHVLLEIEVPAEPLPANFARERFLVVMRMHVECEVVDLVERFVADVTFVCLFTAVR